MPPAARISDMHTCPMVTPGLPPIPHVGGPILPPGEPTVLIGFLPAARVSDMCVCVGPPDAIAMGSPTVLIGYLMAARMGDSTVHGGVIVLGEPTVMIGESGGGGAGPGAGGGAGGAASVSAGTTASGADSDSANASVYSQRARDDGSPAPGGQGAAAGAPQGKQATPHTGYKSQDEAAKAALNDANPQSIKANKEYGGLIYKDKDGTYGYTGPKQGSDQGANPADSPAPPGTTVVGDYHTHGDYSTVGPNGEAVRTNDPAKDQFNSDHFSGTDKTGITQDAANKPGYQGYLGTPSGKFLKFNPQTGNEEPLP